MDMIRVSASQLKAKMGQYMRALRAGNEVVITDRDRPVARLVPYEHVPKSQELVVVQPADPTAPPLGQLEIHPIDYRGRRTSELLAEDRRKR